MDFFEAQARAKRRTTRLVVLFVFAVAGTIVATYAAAAFILTAARDEQRDPSREAATTAVEGTPSPYWQPDTFFFVALGTLAVVGLGSLYKWNQFRAGGSAVAESVGARRVDPGTANPAERRLLNVVEEMAIASGVPVPPVYVLDEEGAINAFAAGLTTHDAVVAVTRGTIEKLSRDELQGVVGHEFSHILNGDMRLNVRITAILFGILLIGLIGRGILRTMGRARIRSSGKGKSGGAIAGIMLLGLALMIIGYIGYFFGRLIQAAVSRQREFLADAAAVQFTRNPAGIAGALKKIGGFSLGSRIESEKGAALGHFFFAQGFRSFLGGIMATHPPLAERIRAIEPRFDGKMITPPAEIAEEEAPTGTAGLVSSPPRATPSVTPPKLPPAAAPLALDRAGALTPEQIADSRQLLDSVPPALLGAARQATTAPALLYGLLLSHDSAVRARQGEIVATEASAEARAALQRLENDLLSLRPEQRLPLLYVTLPVLRGIARDRLAAFLGTLDALVHADSAVSTFEFALQRLVIRTLNLGQTPGAAVVQYQSFHAVADEISVVLSALARASSSDPSFAQQAFATGVRQLPLIADRLRFASGDSGSLERLAKALDKLAGASGPIKQRTLLAAAYTVGADGQILVAEAELLRAIAASLDCPMPPLTAAV